MVKYLPGIYEAMGSNPSTGGRDAKCSGSPSRRRVPSRDEACQSSKSSTWIYLQGASACSSRKAHVPDL